MAAITQELRVQAWRSEWPNTMPERSAVIRPNGDQSPWVLPQRFDRITDAIAAERQVKGWSRAKKEALIRGDFTRLPELSKRRRPNGANEDR